MAAPETDPAARLAARWTARVDRARALAAEVPAAAGILTFYAGLAEQQRVLALSEWAPPAAGPGAGGGSTARARRFRDALDTGPAAAAIPGLLAWLARHAPEALADEVRAIASGSGPADWRGLLAACLAGELDDEAGLSPAMAFVASAALQPFAEALALVWPSEEPAGGNGHDGFDAPAGGHLLAAGASCHVCGGTPLLGVLREEGHGARRQLVCAFCLSERTYRRVICPSCGEDRFDALPVFTAEQFGHVRIEACDSCRTYLKSIDLTKNGLAVPLVDDLASVSLDLWARDRGYRRLQENLLRV